MKSQRDRLAAFGGATVLLDRDRTLLEGEPDHPPTAPHARGLAYVIYTSGSTGRPKGVEVEQRGLAALLSSQVEAFRLTPDSRVLWLLSPVLLPFVAGMALAYLLDPLARRGERFGIGRPVSALVVLTVVLVAIAYLVAPGSAEQRVYSIASDFTRQIHETTGILIFAIVLARILWRTIDAAPEAPPPPTTLVFKDGRRLQVGNYAIVGATMFDLTPGHPRKIALADVDLEATQKENEDHGVSFQLPSNSPAN